MRLDATGAKRLGDRLRIARTTSGYTQVEAAEKLGVARTTLVAIEAGERAVRPNELETLARLYKTSVNALLRETAIHVDLVGQFRREPAGTQQDRAGLEALKTLNQLATSYVELEGRLNRPLRTDYPPERPIGRGSLSQQAEDLALEVRTRLGVGLAPITDLVTLLELEMGVRIFVRRLPSKIAGVFAYHESLGACILVNSVHPKERRRWTLAHELGHLLTTRNLPDVCYLVDADDTRKSIKLSKPVSERFADQFAGALLMPAAAVRQAFDELADANGNITVRGLILIAQRFHVSIEAMCRRLADLGLVEKGTFEMLRRRGFSTETVRRVVGTTTDEAEEGADFIGTPSRFVLMAADAYYQDLLSEGQLVEMLALDRVRVRQLLDELDDADTVLEGPRGEPQ